MYCRYCGQELPDDSKFCSKCGQDISELEDDAGGILSQNLTANQKRETITHQGHIDDGMPTEKDKRFGPVAGCLTGLVGTVMGLFGLAAGIGLTMTGIGAIIGIPMILGALAVLGMGFVAPIAGVKSFIKGVCPYCGYELTVSPTDPGINCSACKQRVVIRDKKFYKVK